MANGATGWWPKACSQALNNFLNRDLPAHVRIGLRVRWPLMVLPVAIINQLFAPHPVWIVLAIVLLGVYGFAYWWSRTQAPVVSVTRHRLRGILVAGDTLEEEFELHNSGMLPVLWAEVVDQSNLAEYNAGRVVACGGMSFYRWRTDAVCKSRGLFRLGPHRVILADPFGLFQTEVISSDSDVIVVYPKVTVLEGVPLPPGDARGTNRRRRPLLGNWPAATVSDYRPGDSLRNIHWPSTAHRGRLMVKDMEIEPSGDVWIVLDLFRGADVGTGENSTIEHSVTIAASVAAELLTGAERRAVGLVTVSSVPALAPQHLGELGQAEVEEGAKMSVDTSPMVAAPVMGQAQLWRILGILAPVRPTRVPLAELLRSNRDLLGRRRSVVVITADVQPLQGDGSELGSDDHWAALLHGSSVDGNDVQKARSDRQEDDKIQTGFNMRTNWLAELLHLQSAGLSASVVLVTPREEDDQDGKLASHAGTIRTILAEYDIPVAHLRTGVALRSVLTFRRTRQVVRTTPTGGVVTYEIEEEVG